MYQIRSYHPGDCEQMIELFRDTVHTVCRKDYSGAQLDAWAWKDIDRDAWNRSFLIHHTLVALKGRLIVGFGDMDDTGYLDRLYVHRDYQGRGIASEICDILESSVSGRKLTTHASITAKPFFEKRGYIAVAEQTVDRRGVSLTNYVMEKPADNYSVYNIRHTLNKKRLESNQI